MGNLFRKKKEPNQPVESIRVSHKGTSIYGPGTSIIPFSVSSLDEYIKAELSSMVSTSSCTRPSVYHSEESENISSHKDVEETESVILTAAQLENIYEQYKAMNSQSLSEGLFMPYETSKVVKHLLDMWQTDMIFKFDNYQIYASTDVNLLKKYSEGIKDAAESDPQQMFLRHTIKMIITYKMILDRLDNDRAEELLQQLAISHGLLGVKGEDFKEMDLHLTKYLLQRNLINDESIISLVAFLSLTSDEVKRSLSERRNKARNSYISQMGLVGRPNITRDNYRCMKQWSQVVSLINTKADIILKQIRRIKPEVKTEDDMVTIDTETLKAKDCLIRRLRKIGLLKTND
ncbi:uncharacterized protein LOC123316884 [Coccinella septempunctata]|uniref:uncharacterized protein LOC123316884 n=1 Tax=Coccinella septempunctata TaxID=41139 RepID=UPI001D067FDD|nr:uncharacterized protein LOC123316884 [Coccinella septempunctata]